MNSTLDRMALKLPKKLPLIRRLPKEFKKLLPLLYIFSLLIGFLLIIVYAFVPSFVTCSSFFGEEFCTPTGIFIALTASLPGYLVAGNVLYFISDFPWIFSLIIVIILSTVIYFLMGMGIDSLRKKKMSTELVSKVVIVCIFIILLLLLLALIINQQN